MRRTRRIFTAEEKKKITELETKLQKKDEVIAEIAEENMMLKKTFGGRS